MASRGEPSAGAAHRVESAELRPRVTSACAARREDYGRIKAALAQIDELIARRNALGRRTTPDAPPSETETDIVRQLAVTVEGVRDLVLTSERRLQAIEDELLGLIHDAAYLTKPAGAAPREPTLHVPTSSDLDRLAEETGVAGLAQYTEAVTCVFVCPL